MSFEEELISLVRKDGFLYNSKCKTHTNLLSRNARWNAIAKELNRSVKECKRRWRSLRDRYVREKRKMEHPSETDFTETQKWAFLDSLEFLNTTRQPSRKYTQSSKQLGNFSEIDMDASSSTQDTSFLNPSVQPCREHNQSPKQLGNFSEIGMDAFSSTQEDTSILNPSLGPSKQYIQSPRQLGNFSEIEMDASSSTQDTSSPMEEAFIKFLENVSTKITATIAEPPPEKLNYNQKFMAIMALRMEQLSEPAKIRIQTLVLNSINEELLKKLKS